MIPFMFRVLNSVKKEDNLATEVDFVLTNDHEVKVTPETEFVFTPEAPFPYIRSSSSEELVSLNNVEIAKVNDKEWVDYDTAVTHQLTLLAVDALKGMDVEAILKDADKGENS